VKKRGGPKPAPNFERGLDRMNASRMTCLPCLTRFNNVHVHGACDMFADPHNHLGLMSFTHRSNVGSISHLKPLQRSHRGDKSEVSDKEVS
jgi:hypothetical protein